MQEVNGGWPQKLPRNANHSHFDLCSFPDPGKASMLFIQVPGPVKGSREQTVAGDEIPGSRILSSVKTGYRHVPMVLSGPLLPGVFCVIGIVDREVQLMRGAG
jgi:hypothetical protein